MVKGDAWMNCYTGETVTKTQGLTSVAITNAQVLARCQPCTILFLDQTNPERYIYMGSGRFPGPMELLLQQLVRVSKTR